MLTYQQFVTAHKNKYDQQRQEWHKKMHPLADMQWIWDGLNAVHKEEITFIKKAKRLYRKYRRGKYQI